MSLHGVTEDQPFGDDNITFRVEGKIFLCLWLGDGKCDVRGSASRFACKLLPDRNEELRDRYDAVAVEDPAVHTADRGVKEQTAVGIRLAASEPEFGLVDLHRQRLRRVERRDRDPPPRMAAAHSRGGPRRRAAA